MILQDDDNLLEKFVELLSAPEKGGIRHMLQVALDACERRKHLGFGPYERSEVPVDHGNGFKDRTLKTRVGELNFEVPQVRSSNFYPSCFVNGLHSERDR